MRDEGRLRVFRLLPSAFCPPPFAFCLLPAGGWALFVGMVQGK